MRQCNTSKNYRQARIIFYCVLVMFVIIELFAFLWFSTRLQHKSDATVKNMMAQEQSDTSGTDYPAYDETVEWSDSVVVLTQALGVTGYDANLILHEIADVYKEQYGRQFYFFNEFTPVDGLDAHYIISSGDNAARFEVKIKQGKVTYIQNLGIGGELYES